MEFGTLMVSIWRVVGKCFEQLPVTATTRKLLRGGAFLITFVPLKCQNGRIYFCQHKIVS